MDKLMKFLTPLIALAAMFLFVSPAQAAPSIPPTEECVGLMQAVLDEAIRGGDSAKEEQALLKQMVDQGCLTANPMSDEKIPDMPKAECAALASEVSNYLAPANRAARPIQNRINAVSKRLNKKTNREIKRLDRAQKKGNKKAVKKISKRLNAISKQYWAAWKKIGAASQGATDKYAASTFLVLLDMGTRGCEPGSKWDKQNPASDVFTFLIFFAGAKS